MKTVRIKTEGCDIFPHNTVHKVFEVKEGVYPTFDGRDRIPLEWCEDIKEPLTNADFKEGITLKGFRLFNEQGTFYCVDRQQSYTWNEFRRLGYYKEGNKTGFFTEDEYSVFEDYSTKNNLKISHYQFP